eukprot:6476673-Amphidinium_carterae.1
MTFLRILTDYTNPATKIPPKTNSIPHLVLLRTRQVMHAINESIQQVILRNSVTRFHLVKSAFYASSSPTPSSSSYLQIFMQHGQGLGLLGGFSALSSIVINSRFGDEFCNSKS